MNPICMTGVLCVVFSQLFHEDIWTYAPYVLSGMAFWNFMTGTIIEGCQSYYQGETYIRQHPAPLAIYPLRTTLGMGVHFLMALIVLLSMVWLLALWSVVPAFALMFLLAWTTAAVLGVMTVMFPDVQHLVHVGMQVLFYMTPIFYSSKLLDGHGLGWVLKWNPLAACLELLRAPILDAQLAAWQPWCLAAGTTCLTTAAAAWTFSKIERKLIFYL
jgi:lipopolysaccharide transport system permease protein